LVLGLAFSLLVVSSSATFRPTGSFDLTLVNIAAAFIATASVAAGLFKYLQDSKPTALTPRYDDSIKAMDEMLARMREMRFERQTISVTPEERASVIEEVKHSLGTDVPERLAHIWHEQFRERDAEDRRANDLFQTMRSVAPRILGEVDSLKHAQTSI
jgi:hypothetical protein